MLNQINRQVRDSRTYHMLKRKGIFITDFFEGLVNSVAALITVGIYYFRGGNKLIRKISLSNVLIQAIRQISCAERYNSRILHYVWYYRKNYID